MINNRNDYLRVKLTQDMAFVSGIHPSRVAKDPLLLPESEGMIYSSYVDDPHYNIYALALACEKNIGSVPLTCLRDERNQQKPLWFVSSFPPNDISLYASGRIHFLAGVFVASAERRGRVDNRETHMSAVRACNDYNGWLRGEVFDVETFSIPINRYNEIFPDGIFQRATWSMLSPDQIDDLANDSVHVVAYGINRANDLSLNSIYALEKNIAVDGAVPQGYRTEETAYRDRVAYL